MRPDIFLGSELAEIRIRDALRAEERRRLLAAADEGRQRGQPSIGRPLDDCVFEDLGRSPAPHD